MNSVTVTTNTSSSATTPWQTRMRHSLVGSPEDGDFDWQSMCAPQWPWQRRQGDDNSNNRRKSKFYGPQDAVPWLWAILAGLQHASAMVGGTAAVPLLLFRTVIAPEDSALQQYAVAASLICAGLATAVQVSCIPIPGSAVICGRTLTIGTGVLCVMGTSATFWPVFAQSIGKLLNDDEHIISPRVAYGKLLGTSMACSTVEIVLSLQPLSVLRRHMMPPVVTAVTVLLIGISVTGAGWKMWGGGLACADYSWRRSNSFVAGTAGSDATAPRLEICRNNGDVELPYGHANYLGLGAVVAVTLLVIELFGSVWMRNCNLLLALICGTAIAAIVSYQGKDYVVMDINNDTKEGWFTFVWAETFPLGFYAPAVLPMMIAYFITTVETVGDISTVYNASRLDTTSEAFTQSMQGGLLADAICSILANLGTAMPNTTYSLGGIIALTENASRRVGYATAVWMIGLGVWRPFTVFLTGLPDCILGAMLLFIFGNITVAGLALCASLDLEHSRKNRFIVAWSVALGVGVTISPYAFADLPGSPGSAMFWTCEGCSDTLQGFRNGVALFLSTGYSVGAVIALLLHLLIPHEEQGIITGNVLSSTTIHPIPADTGSEDETQQQMKRQFPQELTADESNGQDEEQQQPTTEECRDVDSCDP
eukprot:scaffold126_cov178-Amphora_coffeaeformis.AAC.2